MRLEWLYEYIEYAFSIGWCSEGHFRVGHTHTTPQQAPVSIHAGNNRAGQIMKLEWACAFIDNHVHCEKDSTDRDLLQYVDDPLGAAALNNDFDAAIVLPSQQLVAFMAFRIRSYNYCCLLPDRVLKFSVVYDQHFCYTLWITYHSLNILPPCRLT